MSLPLQTLQEKGCANMHALWLKLDRLSPEAPNVPWDICTALFQELSTVQECSWVTLQPLPANDECLKTVKDAMAELGRSLGLSRPVLVMALLGVCGTATTCVHFKTRSRHTDQILKVVIYLICNGGI
jgi:xanthine dehydrogenase iron-sulfur cluster and FAD-binding subunit A